MGLGDFFKNIFGKKTCAFCGGECGMLNRTKIKGDEYICGKCDDMCSFHIQKYRFTKDELRGHMEYMKRSDRIYKEVALAGEMTEEQQVEIQKNMNAMDDANTGGLAEYTRRADAAEAKIN